MNKQMKFILIICFTFFLLQTEINTKRRSSKSSTSSKLKTKSKLTDNNYIDFILGMGTGYGLSLGGIEALKKCFVDKSSENSQVVDIFIEKSDPNNISENDKVKNNKVESQSFVASMSQFFSLIGNCVALQDTIFSFIKGKIYSYGIKGLTYAIGGLGGLALKAAWDTYKLKGLIDHFYQVQSTQPVDYTELGSDVGKIISKIQSIAFKKRFR